MNRKVLIHAPELSTPGGKQTYFAAVKNHYHSEVSFFFYGAKGKKESSLGTISRLLSDYRRFYRLLKNGGFDIVHLNPSMNPKSFFRDSVFALICSWLNVKSVVFWHGWRWSFEKKVAKRMLPLFHMTYGKADAMILLAREFLERVRAYGYEKPLYLETTVVDDTIFDFETGPEDAAETGETSILFLARIEKAKGIYEAIDSVHRLQADFPNIRLKVAGTGGELEAARQYVADKGIKKIDFLGWISGRQKAEAFYQSDIYVLASYYGEGMPISLLEAMASGLAVATTDVGGIKDFFENEKMGLFVAPNDTDDLEQKLRRLLAEPELLRCTGSYNAVYARDHFTPRLVSQRLERIYSNTISGADMEAGGVGLTNRK